MATIQEDSKIDHYSASDDVLQWLESISGLVTYIQSKYGGVLKLIENSKWDESKNQYALALVLALKREIALLEKEFKIHVNGP
jgi:hypothetical protein